MSETQNAGDDDSDKRHMQRLFGQGLIQELDRLHYHPNSSRSAELGRLLELNRTQGYRILMGNADPKLTSLVRMRKIGVSFDHILDKILNSEPEVLELLVNGTPVAAVARQATSPSAATVMLRKSAKGYCLEAVTPGEPIPTDATAIEGLLFPSVPSLAIVDDDLSTLDTLADGVASVFRAVKFATGNSLLERGTGLSQFRAYLVDWRLPDISGDELIRKIRAISTAPIFILTGDNTASESIAKTLTSGNTNLYYIPKPVSLPVLVGQLKNTLSL